MGLSQPQRARAGRAEKSRRTHWELTVGNPFDSTPMADLSPVTLPRRGSSSFSLEHSEIRDAVLYCTLSGTWGNHPAGQLGRSRSNCRNIVLYLREPESEWQVAERSVFRQSCKTTVNRDLLTFTFPLYSMKPSFLNLFIKKLTRDRVVPTISARVSCETFGNRPSGCSCLP